MTENNVSRSELNDRCRVCEEKAMLEHKIIEKTMESSIQKAVTEAIKGSIPAFHYWIGKLETAGFATLLVFVLYNHFVT